MMRQVGEEEDGVLDMRRKRYLWDSRGRSRGTRFWKITSCRLSRDPTLEHLRTVLPPSALTEKTQ